MINIISTIRKLVSIIPKSKEKDPLFNHRTVFYDSPNTFQLSFKSPIQKKNPAPNGKNYGQHKIKINLSRTWPQLNKAKCHFQSERDAQHGGLNKRPLIKIKSTVEE